MGWGGLCRAGVGEERNGAAPSQGAGGVRVMCVRGEGGGG